MFSNQSGSRRWTHFHSALQLAVQRSAHKWTFEDFAECFPQYVEEDKNGSSATFNSISDYIEAQNFRDLDKLFRDYNVQENIDTLHKIVTEAKDRKLRSLEAKDAWKPDLDPKSAVSARTIPVLNSEAERLQGLIAQAERESRELMTELQDKAQAADETNERVLEMLTQLHAVSSKWQKAPLDEIEAWTVQTAESLKPVLHS